MSEVIEGTQSESAPTPVAETEASPVAKALAALEGAPKQAEGDKKVEPKVEEKKPEENVASKFVALARKEKANLEAQGKLKAQQAEIEAKSKAIQEFEASKKRALENPEEIAKQLWGEDWYQKLTEYVLQGGSTKSMQEEASIKAVRELREELKAEKEAAVKAKEAEVQASIERFNNEAIEYVTSKPDLFELININEAQYLVPQVIEEHYGKTQKILTFQEAGEMVESYLEEQVKKNAASKKFQAKVAPGAKPSEKVEQGEEKQSKTLSNKLDVSGVPSFINDAESEDARFLRAMKALEG